MPIPYGRQSITEEDISAVSEALKSDFLTQGPQVAAFEKEFAAYIGAHQAVAVNNATAGLHLALLALGVKPGQRVITTPNSFAASANCVLYCGAEVSFVDIDPQTRCLDIVKLEALLGAHPTGYFAGVIPVDFAGYPLDLLKLRELCDRYKLWMVEDACHAPGGSFKDHQGQTHRCGDGSLADLAVFSFHPVKHIACGEGGMVTGRKHELLEKVRLLRSHGITKDPSLMQKVDGGWAQEMIELGYNYRMPDILCALGRTQLRKQPAGLKRRGEIAHFYQEELRGTSLVLPPADSEVLQQAWHLYVVQAPERKRLYDHLKSVGIYAQVHYPPIHQHPYYQRRYGEQHFPVAEKHYQHALSLPMFPTLSDEDLRFIVQQVKQAL